MHIPLLLAVVWRRVHLLVVEIYPVRRVAYQHFVCLSKGSPILFVDSHCLARSHHRVVSAVSCVFVCLEGHRRFLELHN